MFDPEDIVGNKSGKLTVDEYLGKRVGSTGYTYMLYRCSCECGGSKDIARSSLIKGATKSCGCIHKKLKHGGSYDNAYWSWISMMRRCYDKEFDSFPHYGGRGISVCKEWHDYENFKRDMGEREKGLSIERVDVDGNYEPENCVWVDNQHQQWNKRNSRHIEFEGKTYNYSELARMYGVKPTLFHGRMKLGWSVGEALGIVARQIKHVKVGEK